MSEVMREAQQEFWRPPSPVIAEPPIVHESVPAMAEACSRCGTEFLVGTGYCHSCGKRRPLAMSAAARADAAVIAGLWENFIHRTHGLVNSVSSKKFTFPGWMHYLHFHEIKRWVGLPTPSLIAFLFGLGCVAGALGVGLLSVKTLVDWQAIQLYRAEWLLGATASFVAGILLKRSSGRDRD